MVVRRPIVMVGGKPKQLPAADTLAGVPVMLPVGLFGGAVQRVSLDAAARLPVGLATGGVVYAQTGV